MRSTNVTVNYSVPASSTTIIISPESSNKTNISDDETLCKLGFNDVKHQSLPNLYRFLMTEM